MWHYKILFPSSTHNFLGILSLINFSNAFVTDAADLSFIGTAHAYLLNTSITVRIYLNPLLKERRVCRSTKSADHISSLLKTCFLIIPHDPHFIFTINILFLDLTYVGSMSSVFFFFSLLYNKVYSLYRTRGHLHAMRTRFRSRYRARSKGLPGHCKRLECNHP